MFRIADHIEQSIATKRAILSSPDLLEKISGLGELAGQTLAAGGKVILAGNGGSFADSQHIAAEFVSKLLVDRVPLAAVSLGTNSSAMSAIGNDYGYEKVFSRELEALADERDLFIPVSTSGNSLNILLAAETAKRMNLETVGLTGATGGRLAGICTCIQVPSTETVFIQESHIMIGHIVCSIAEQQFLASR